MSELMKRKFNRNSDSGLALHNDIQRKLFDFLQLSEKKRKEQTQRWAENEQIFRLYAKSEKKNDLCDEDEKGQNPYKYETIVVPYSYAILMTMHTYLCTVFFSRDPIHQYTAYSIDKGIGPQAMEALVQYQITQDRTKLAYFIWILDTLKYGEGWLGTYWDEKKITVASLEEVKEVQDGIPTGRTVEEFKRKTLTKYEGNSCFNIRPTKMFPDPRVSLAKFQEGEFLIRELDMPKHDLRSMGMSGDYFNVDEALKSKKTDSKRNETGVSSERMPDTSEDMPNSARSDMYTVHECYVRLQPKTWKLDSGSNQYEIWRFTMVNESIIVEARPMGELHGEYPFDILTSDFNIYEVAAYSPLETLEGLNNALTWLLNSHMFNVRKTLNDNMIYDPSRINERDFLKSRAGRMARLRPTAYGTDPRLAIHQMQIHDVTRAHISDMEMLMDVMQRVSGVNDNLMGTVNPGGRKTATEIRTSSTSSANRLQLMAEYMSILGIQPHSMKLVANNQQYYNQEQTLQIAGSLINPAQGEKGVEVTPESIAGNFNFVPVDGTLPIDRFLQANLYKEMFSTASQIPAMMQRYDLPRLFAYAMSLSGVKNMAQFEIAPDDQIPAAAVPTTQE